MGMYTEFVCAFELKKDIPKNIINILDFMVNGEENIKEKNLIVPDDEFFKCDRWRMLFCCDSYYFEGTTNTILKYDNLFNYYSLTIRSNLKNYNDEIEKFLKWIKPYIEYHNDFIGYSRYEENYELNLIYISQI